MKLEDVKHIINEYFEHTSPDEVIKIFEAMGCEFEIIKDEEVKEEQTDITIKESNKKLEKYMNLTRKEGVF